MEKIEIVIRFTTDHGKTYEQTVFKWFEKTHLERKVLHYPGLEIHLSHRRVIKDGHEIHLSRYEYGVLSLLARHPGRLFTKEQMYTDRLNGLLPEEDFQRIFTRIKLEREQLEGRRKSLELKKKSPVSQEDEAKELVQRFLETGGENRELLVSLIERIELTADKEIIIKFGFPELDEKAKKK